MAGRSLDREPDGDDLDRLVRQVWGQVSVLRASRIVTATCAWPTSSSATERGWLIDFGFSELAADDVLSTATRGADGLDRIGDEAGAGTRGRGRGHGSRCRAPVRPPLPTGPAERGHADLAGAAARCARRAGGGRRRAPEPTGPPHSGGAPCHPGCHHRVECEPGDPPGDWAVRGPLGPATRKYVDGSCRFRYRRSALVDALVHDVLHLDLAADPRLLGHLPQLRPGWRQQGDLDDLRDRPPVLGVFVYLIARGHKMGEHAVAAAEEADEAQRAYIQSVVTNAGAPPRSSPSWPSSRRRAW